MRGNLARKRRGLAARRRGDRRQLGDRARISRARAPELAGTRLEIIPNPVNVAGLRARAAATSPPLRGAVRALSRQAGAEQRHRASRRRRRARGSRLAAGDRRRRARSAARSRRRRRDRAATSAWSAGSIRRAAVGVAGARVAADLPVARARVAQPRADRSERARRADRRDEHRRHTRHRHDEETGPAVGDARRARRRCAPAAGG